MAAILICELHKILAAMSTGHRLQSWHVPPMDAAQLADDSGDPLRVPRRSAEVPDVIAFAVAIVCCIWKKRSHR